MNELNQNKLATIHGVLTDIRSIPTQTGMVFAVCKVGEHSCKLFGDLAKLILANPYEYEGRDMEAYGHSDVRRGNEFVIDGFGKQALQTTPTPAIDNPPLSAEFEPKNPELRSAEGLNIDRKSSHTIAVGLALVLLSSVFGFLIYHSRAARNNPQAGDTTTPAKAAELPSIDATASVKPSSATTPFSPPTARLDLPGFMLQVGAMRHKANADALAQDLQEKNFPAFVFRRGTDRFYTVSVGPYSDEDSSVRVKDELEKHGLKAFLRHWVPE
jgi:hypothetical protein